MIDTPTLVDRLFGGAKLPTMYRQYGLPAVIEWPLSAPVILVSHHHHRGDYPLPPMNRWRCACRVVDATGRHDAWYYAVPPLHLLLRAWQWWYGARWCLEVAGIRHGWFKLPHESSYLHEGRWFRQPR